MKTDIDDGLSPFTPRDRRYQDDLQDYVPTRRRQANHHANGRLVYSVDDDYDDENSNYEQDYYDDD